MVWLVFIPLLAGSIIGLAFVLMLIARIGRLPVENSQVMNSISQHLVAGDKEKAIFILEEDNHPASTLLAFAFTLSIKNASELNDAFQYGLHEMRRRLIKGTTTLAWLTIAIPVLTLAAWLVLPAKPNTQMLWVILSALVAEIFLWGSTLFYVKSKTKAILERAQDQFRFLSGLILEKAMERKTIDITGLVDDTQDIIELTPVQRLSEQIRKESMGKKK